LARPNLITRPCEPSLRIPHPSLEAPRLPANRKPSPKNMQRRQLSLRRIANVRAVATAVRDAEIGGAVGVAGVAVSACPNPSSPGQLQKRHAPIGQKERIVLSAVIDRNEANTDRRRGTSPSCCPASPSQNISGWRRVSRLKRIRDQGLSRRVPMHRSRLPRRFPRTNRSSRSQKRTNSHRSRNLKIEQLTTAPEAQPRTLRSDLPSGIMNRSVCTR